MSTLHNVMCKLAGLGGLTIGGELLYLKISFMFLQARVDKAKLQQDEQHQRQVDHEQLDNNSLFSVNQEYYWY